MTGRGIKPTSNSARRWRTAGATVAAATLVASAIPGAAPAAGDGQDASTRYTIEISPQQRHFYAGETGYLQVRVTRDGAPARDQQFRLRAQPLKTMFTTPVVPIGGEFRVTDLDGRSRVPIKFARPAEHSVIVSIGHNILDSDLSASITIFVERRWYRDAKTWLEAALALLVVFGAVVWSRRRRLGG